MTVYLEQSTTSPPPLPQGSWYKYPDHVERRQEYGSLISCYDKMVGEVDMHGSALLLLRLRGEGRAPLCMLYHAVLSVTHHSLTAVFLNAIPSFDQ